MESESFTARSSLSTEASSVTPSSMNGNGTLCFSIGIFLACVGGLFANVFVISAMLTSPDLRQKSSSKLTLSFLVSSTFLAITGMTLVAVSWYNDHLAKDGEYVHPTAWVALFALTWGFAIAHHFTSCTLALTRLVSMLRPSAYQRVMTNKSVFFVLVPWLISVLLGIPALFGALGVPNIELFEYVTSPDQTLWEKIGMKIYILVSIAFPVSVTCISYGIMFTKVSKPKWSSNGYQHEISSHRMSQWRSGVTRALLANVISHLCFNIPHIISHLVTVNPYESRILPAVHIIYTIQYILDPLMFVIFAQQYRKACGRLYRCTMRERSQVSDDGWGTAQI